MTNYEYDSVLRDSTGAVFCGVDEAGRGPLAGPVYAAAVILPDYPQIEGLDDSKKLSEAKREKLFDEICDTAIAYSIASAGVEEIDTYNILQATFMAMTRAVEGLSKTPDFALIDGNRAPTGLSLPSKTLIKGDALSASIAAASILAKVSRDRVMLEMDKQYPQYGFAKHKGYGTKLHYEALTAHGITLIHRRTFLKNFLGEQ